MKRTAIVCTRREEAAVETDFELDRCTIERCPWPSALSDDVHVGEGTQGHSLFSLNPELERRLRTNANEVRQVLATTSAGGATSTSVRERDDRVRSP